MANNLQIVEAINNALDSEIGVEVKVSCVETFQRRYYAERRRMIDALGKDIPLVCRIPKMPNTVWLVRSDRGETKDASTPEPGTSTEGDSSSV